VQLNVTNHKLCVGKIEATGIAAAAMLQIGDTEQVTLYSMFDTPLESVAAGPIAPLGPPDESE